MARSSRPNARCEGPVATQHEVNAACEALTARGERPTVERVWIELQSGRASVQPAPFLCDEQQEGWVFPGLVQSLE